MDVCPWFFREAPLTYGSNTLIWGAALSHHSLPIMVSWKGLQSVPVTLGHRGGGIYPKPAKIFHNFAPGSTGFLSFLLVKLGR